MKAAMNNWHDWTTETRPDVLMARYEQILADSGFRVLEKVHHFFSPHGFTALILLAESHFAIHTFPEENKTYLELSSCVDKPFFEFLERVKTHEFSK